MFNMGIGFILIVDQAVGPKVFRPRAEKLGETCHVIGWVDAAPAKTDEPQVMLVRREG